MNRIITGLCALATLPACYAQWSTIEMTFEQDQASGAGDFNRVYVTGGFDYSFNYQYIIQEYDRGTGLWSDEPMFLNTGRMKATTAICGNRLLCAGGSLYPSIEEVGSVEIYDLDTRTLIAEDQLSDPRVEIAPATVGTTVLFAGGMDTEWNGTDYTCVPTDVVDIYDVITQVWTVAHLSQARGGMASAVVDGKAYFAGGYQGAGVFSDRVDIYDGATGDWSTTTLSQARAFYGGGLAVGGKVMFAGGITGDEACSAVVDIYDPVSGMWSMASLSSPREGVQATAVGNYAIFAGGGCGVSNWYYTSGSDRVDVYNTITEQWSIATMSHSRINFMAATSGNQAFLIGGYDFANDVVPLTVDVFTDASTIGMEEQTGTPALSAWPNPFTDKLNLGSLDALAGCTVEVYDARGARIVTTRLKNTLAVDLSILNDGLYQVRVLSADGMRTLMSGPVVKGR